MKNITTLLLFLFINISSFSQIVLNDYNGETVNTCGEQFILNGTHNAGDTYIVTLCDNDPDSTHVSAAFSAWNFGGGDMLCVYDGTDTSYPLLGCYDETNFQVPWAMTASPSNMTGCLTFVFVSNGGGSSFESTTNCEFHCQYFNAVIDSTSEPIHDNLYVDVCQGSTITFYGSGNYLYNGGLYNQSDSQCSFEWDFGDGSPVQTGQVVTHTFPHEGGGYMINLKITDQYGCVNRNDIDLKVRQSMTPEWRLGTDTICPMQVVTVDGAAASPPAWDNTPTTVVAGETYLPDGDGDSYQTDLTFDIFGDQTLDSLNMLEGICVNMEHSFLGDLVMQITCPNGQTVTLENQGGGGTYLGEPIDGYDDATPGVGYDYCWGPNPTYGVMNDEASNYSTLPAGTYTSYESLSGLLGCPLNGIWTFTVTDNWSADDGFIFSWGIDFAPWVFPDYWGFQNTITQYDWTGENILTYQDSVITVAPTTEGSACYNVTVTDDFGCTYDTVTCITVRNANDPECYCETPPTIISFQNPNCFGDNVTYTYTGNADINNSTFTWNFAGGTVVSGDVSGPGPIEVSYPTDGTFNVSLHVVQGICVPSDSTFQVVIPPQLTANISGTNELCYGDAIGTINVQTNGGTTPYSYTWSDGGNATPDRSNLIAGNYIVTISDANGCSLEQTYEVTQPPLLQIIDESHVDILCNGDHNGEINIQATGGTPNLTYDIGSTTQVNDGHFTQLDGGTYNITITDVNGCTTISSPITIIEPPKLQFTNIQVTPISCYGMSDGKIITSVTGGAGNYDFNLNNNHQTSGTFTGLDQNNYTLVVTDDNQCQISFDTTIIEPPKLVASIPNEIVICEGESANIIASVSGGTPSYNYHWGHTSDDIDNVNVSPTNDTQYSLYVTDSKNCTSEKSFCNVLVSPDVFLTAQTDVDSICPGDPVSITSEATGGNHQYTYYIDDNIANNNETVFPPQSHDYTVKVIDGCGKTASVVLPVTVFPVPNINFYPDITSGCQPLKVTFSETSSGTGDNFNWNFGDGSPENIGTQKNPIHIYENSGTFDVSLTVTSSHGCENTLHQYNLIHVYKKPTAKFTANPEITTIIKPTIVFNNLSEDASAYTWGFGDGDSSLVENPIHKYSSDYIKDYLVTLIAESVHGCKDTVKKTVSIKEQFTFYAPTAFTPDGDGINEEFLVKGSGIDLDNFWLGIFDRWGELIWESNDIFQGWNAIAKNHKKVQPGVYKWTVRYKDTNGVEHEETGNVNVIY